MHIVCPHLIKSSCCPALVTDDTDNINQVIHTNSPESCLSYLADLEKKGDPHLDRNHLTRLVDFYTRVFSNMPLGKHCENESYARMLVRFAELKVWVTRVITNISKTFVLILVLILCSFVDRVSQTSNILMYFSKKSSTSFFLSLEFKMWMKQKPTSPWQDLTARSLHLYTLHMHSLNILKVEKRAFCWSLSGILMTCYLGYFSVCFVVSLGNTKRAIYILQNAIELGAKPRELLETTLRSMQAGKTQQSCAEDKENVPCEYLLMYHSITLHS